MSEIEIAPNTSTKTRTGDLAYLCHYSYLQSNEKRMSIINTFA
jgi:hypothetical protein